VTEVAERFQRLAAEVPVVLSVTAGAARKFVPMMAAWDPEPRDSRAAPTERDRVVAALRLLWHALFFATTPYARLKRCDCQRWFVDVTLGNRKKTCSTRCAERIKKRNQRRRDRKRGKGQ
jgi:CGNR zinc finger